MAPPFDSDIIYCLVSDIHLVPFIILNEAYLTWTFGQQALSSAVTPRPRTPPSPAPPSTPQNAQASSEMVLHFNMHKYNIHIVYS